MPRKHIIVSGRVQGGGFRNHACRLANTHQLTGWVRNLNSGDVELEVQGYSKNIEDFLSGLGKGSFFIHIEELLIDDCKEVPESEFGIK